MPFSYTLIFSYVYLAFGIFIFLLGLTILRTGGSSPTTRSTALILFFCGVGPILSATNIILLNSLKAGSVVYTSMVENFEYLWEFYFPSLFLFSLTFPKENKVIKKYGFLAILIFVPHIVHLFTMIVADSSSHFATHLLQSISSRTDLSVEKGKLAFAGISNLLNVFISLLVRAHRQLFSLVDIGFAVLAIGFLARNSRGILSPRINKQLRTVLLGITVSVATYGFTRIALIFMSGSLPDEVNLGLINFSLLAGGGSVGYAVVRQQFLGIRFIMRKIVLYGGVAVVFAVLYLVVVKPVSVFFGNYSVAGQEAFETGFIILSIIAFQPVLARVEELLERYLLRGKDDTRILFKALGSDLMNAVTIEELEDRLRRGLEKILDVTHTRLVFLGTSERESSAAKLLGEIRDPVTAQELIRLKEKAGSKTPKRFDSPLVEQSDPPHGGEEDFEALVAYIGPDEVLIPVLKENKCAGVIAVGNKSYGRRFTTEELSLLSVLSSELSITMENIRLLQENVEKQVIEEELKLARSIQSKLLPSGSLAIADYDLHAVTRPSRYVGGDLYDFALLDEGTLSFAVADVSGKGVPASLLVATLHAALKSNEDVLRSPREMMKRINRLLYRSTSADQFATLFYGVVDLASGTVRFANAGHDFPVLVNGGGVCRLEEGDIVLGCVEDYPYKEHSCTIPARGGLVLYTDGLTEASADDVFFGQKRLETLLTAHSGKSARQMCDAILSEVTAFTNNDETQDDVTLLILKRKELH